MNDTTKPQLPPPGTWARVIADLKEFVGFCGLLLAIITFPVWGPFAITKDWFTRGGVRWQTRVREDGVDLFRFAWHAAFRIVCSCGFLVLLSFIPVVGWVFLIPTPFLVIASIYRAWKHVYDNPNDYAGRDMTPAEVEALMNEPRR